jgi:type III secretory pathway component EscR
VADEIVQKRIDEIKSKGVRAGDYKEFLRKHAEQKEEEFLNAEKPCKKCEPTEEDLKKKFEHLTPKVPPVLRDSEYNND